MSSLVGLCLRRPVAVTAFYALVLALAAVAFVRLPVALLPDLRLPVLLVWTAYPDVPPERVERGVTERVEEAVAGTPGLRSLSSRSQLGGSLVRLDFTWGSDLDLASLEVREQLDRLGAALPENAEPPVVLRLDPSDRPILLLALGGAASPPAAAGRQDLLRLKQIGRDVVARRLEQLPGVARARVTGGYEPQIEIAADPARLSAHGIALEEIEQALRSANVASSAGLIRRGPFRYAVEVSGELTGVADIGDAVVAERGGAAVRLRDVATVREGVADRRGLVRLNGGEVLLLLIERRPDANTVETAAEVRRILPELAGLLPGVRLDVVADESVFIEEAIDGVSGAVIQGGLLSILVLFVFLRRPQAILAVAVAVPLSLALTLVLFDLLDVSFNLVSLGGLALGVGLLMDNSIVVVENVSRLREKGVERREAARAGTVEVALAITASTLTTIAVFLPLTYVEGLAGRLFRDQSLAVVCSLLASLLVALTAVPVVAARERGRDDSSQALPPGWLRPYERALGFCLAHPLAVLAATAAFLAASALIAFALPREMVPKTDQGRLEVHLSLPTDSDLGWVSDRAAELEARLRALPEVRSVLADLGERDEARLDLEPRPPYQGALHVITQPGAGIGAVVDQLRKMPASPGVERLAKPVRTQFEEILVPDRAELSVDLIGERRGAAEAALGPLLADLRSRRELFNVGRAVEAAVPAYRLHFDRAAMARLGARPDTVAVYLEAAARGREATVLRTVNNEIPIVVRLPGARSLEELLAERVPTASGLVPLGALLRGERVELPAAVLRIDQVPVVRLEADVAPGSDLPAAAAAIERGFAAHLPAGVRGRIGGANEAFRASLRAVGWSLLLSLALVYLILAAQFESLLQPLVILAAVPLAAGGVALALAVTGQTVNLMSLTGAVVLVGIAVNDAIVKVDFINQRRRAGVPLLPAIHEAGRDRARPIVMNTVTAVMGLLPLAFGLGAGGELRAPLAIAIVGGLTSSTVLTLLVVPVLYAAVVGDRVRATGAAEENPGR